jgi:hypothetical protein
MNVIMGILITSVMILCMEEHETFCGHSVCRFIIFYISLQLATVTVLKHHTNGVKSQ